MAKCQSCEAEITWVTTTRADGTEGKPMPLDAEHFVTGMVRFGKDGSKAKFAKVYKSHFATCPYAKEHRTG